MSGMTDAVGRAVLRAASYAAICLMTVGAGTSLAGAETRTLKIYQLHTHEKEEIAFKRNGRYLPEGLKKLNWILRDWRKQRPINMDPRLLDLIWEAYRQSGSNGYINVVCGYRSPATNGMLRSRTAGVAKESQHMLGKAMDFYIPDVSLAKLRAIGLKMQVGGVGYYPRSGSPFVHFDVGNVRHWPRMSRKELLAVFPNGNTVHVPSDGKPLPGYEQALASYKSRKSSSSVQVANASDAKTSSSGGGKTLLAMLFGGGADEEEDTAEAAGAANAPSQAAGKAAKPAMPVIAKSAKPAVEEPTAVAALASNPKRTVLPNGVPLPIRDTFDTSAPKTMVPPADVAEDTAAKTVEVAALDPARIPLPSAAPVRESLLVAEAMKVPVPSEPAKAPQAADSTLMASLAARPAAEEVAANEAGQLAYSVPTPHGRPPFAAILKQETPPADTIDEVRAIVETANAEMPPAPPAARVEASAAALAVPAASVHPVAHPKRPEAGGMLLASLAERKPMKTALTVPAPKAAIPAGKTVRLQHRGVAAIAAAVSSDAPAALQDAISTRIRIADLVTDPNQRSEVSTPSRPNAGRLVRNTPTSVLSTGFSAKPVTTAPSNGFFGSAVHFIPMVKVD